MPIHYLFGCFGGILPPRWDTIATSLPQVESTSHDGSDGVSIMLVSVVVSEKLPGHKV